MENENISHHNRNPMTPQRTEVEESRLEQTYARDNDAILERKKLRNWYEAEAKKLKDVSLTLDDLQNDALWSDHEKAEGFDEEKFASQTDEERMIQTEEQILSGEFATKRKNEIARRKLEKMVDEVAATPPTLEQKLENFSPEQHRALFDRLFE